MALGIYAVMHAVDRGEAAWQSRHDLRLPCIVDEREAARSTPLASSLSSSSTHLSHLSSMIPLVISTMLMLSCSLYRGGADTEIYCPSLCTAIGANTLILFAKTWVHLITGSRQVGGLTG